MAIETFDSDDTLDDGEVYGQFTNVEDPTNNSYVLDGEYVSIQTATPSNHAYLVTTNDIGSIFSYKTDLRVATSYKYLNCGIYLGASRPNSNFDSDATTTSLVNLYIGSSTLYVTRTISGGSKQYWNFTTHEWQASSTAYNNISSSNVYRFTITRDADNLTIEIYDVTGDTLIETITAVNSETKSIDNNAYFYFGSPKGIYSTGYGYWDNAGFEEEEEAPPAALANTMMIQSTFG